MLFKLNKVNPQKAICETVLWPVSCHFYVLPTWSRRQASNILIVWQLHSPSELPKSIKVLCLTYSSFRLDVVRRFWQQVSPFVVRFLSFVYNTICLVLLITLSKTCQTEKEKMMKDQKACQQLIKNANT